MSALREDLRQFDGKAVSRLSEAAVRHGRARGYVDQLLEYCADSEGHVSTGATWLLKAYLDEGGELDAARVDTLAANLSDVQDWQAQLHICQSAARMRFSEKSGTAFLDWLTPLLSHKRPFLRAWSMDALCEIAAQLSDWGSAAREAVGAALEDPAASVRARAKKRA